MADMELKASLKRTSAWLLVPALLFFPMIFNPIIFGFYDPTKGEAELLAFREEHWLAIRLMFTFIGVSFLLMGFALRAWGHHLSATSTGRASEWAKAGGWSGLAGGVLSLLTYSVMWLWTPSEAADFLDSTGGTVLFVAGWIPMSVSFVLLGIVTFWLRAPRWLGVMVVVIAIIPYLTLLPLWFFVGSVLAGVTGLIRSRAANHAGIQAAG